MKCKLNVDIEDMSVFAEEDHEAFALNRRKGFGASDSSIILGVNHWTTPEQLVFQKNQDYITQEELDVGNKPQVRMGNDLEPLILKKASEFFGQEITKPNAQYRFEEYPFLTVNFDGAMSEPHSMGDFTPPVCITVEAKCVSSFARKYWDFNKACKDMDDWLSRQRPYRFAGNSLKEIVEEEAKMYGIPPYYYTQVQQQMMGTCMPYCALVALDVKEWNINVFKIYENEEIQTAIVMAAASLAEQCNQIKTTC